MGNYNLTCTCVRLYIYEFYQHDTSIINSDTCSCISLHWRLTVVFKRVIFNI